MSGPGPARAGWFAVIVLNAVLGVVASIAVSPWLVVVADPGVDPTLVDDGLGVWVVAGIFLGVVYAAVAVPLNVWVARRTGLRGRRWWLVGLLVTIVVAVPVAMVLFAPLWQEYATGLDYGGATN